MNENEKIKELVDILRKVVYNSENRLIKVTNTEYNQGLKEAKHILINFDMENEYSEF